MKLYLKERDTHLNHRGYYFYQRELGNLVFMNNDSVMYYHGICMTLPSEQLWGWYY